MSEARGIAKPRDIAVSWRLIVAALTVLLCGAAGKVFLVLDEESITTDGYANQVMSVVRLLEDGANWWEVRPLSWIHLLRAAVAFQFQIVELLFGAHGSAMLMVVFIWPVLLLFRGAKYPVVGLALFLTLPALSYRSVLVIISVAFLLVFILRSPRKRYLLLSFWFANLSSGAVMICLLVAYLVGRHYVPRSRVFWAFMLALLLSFGISVADKLVGFSAGESGYDATVEGASGLLAVISRSTIFVSFLVGDYMRGLVYIGVLSAVLAGLLRASRLKLLQGYALVFVTGVPAFFLEGLGVMSLLVPVLMYIAGVPMPRRPIAAPLVGNKRKRLRRIDRGEDAAAPAGTASGAAA